MFQELTGKEFNNLNKFYKLTNQSELHYGFQYMDGLNVDTKKFTTCHSFEPGGLYFTSYNNIPLWIEYGGKLMHWIREVTILPDAQVYIGSMQIKADKLHLGPRKLIEDFEAWSDYNYCLRAVRQNGLALAFIKNQTEELCLEAVKQNTEALKYVKNQTKEMCLIAIERYWQSLKNVQNQTPEICLEAIKSCGLALQYVKEQTPEICLVAVTNCGQAIQFVQNQTEELCLEAVKQDGLALRFVQNQTEELCFEAVKENGVVLRYVKPQFLTEQLEKLSKSLN